MTDCIYIASYSSPILGFFDGNYHWRVKGNKTEIKFIEFYQKISLRKYHALPSPLHHPLSQGPHQQESPFWTTQSLPAFLSDSFLPAPKLSFYSRDFGFHALVKWYKCEHFMHFWFNSKMPHQLESCDSPGTAMLLKSSEPQEAQG